jgi:hypothetical protein
LKNHAYFHLPFQSPVGHEREDLISIASLRNKKGKNKKISFPDRPAPFYNTWSFLTSKRDLTGSEGACESIIIPPRLSDLFLIFL